MDNLKAFRVYIYRTGAFGDATNGAPSKDADSAWLVSPDLPGSKAIEDIPDGEPVYWLRKRKGPYSITAVPFEHVEFEDGEVRLKEWVMAGGNFLYSTDSRFANMCRENGHSRAPIAIHDRIES